MSLDVEIRQRFEGFQLNAAFSAPKGVTVLFGRSGSGKTSIVNAVAGLMKPESGRIALDSEALFDSETGVFIPPHRRRLGYVFQEGRLFPHMTVRRNLLYGRVRAGGGPEVDVDRVVEMLGLGDLLGRRPGALSGGEKQRVALGRALLSNPRMILADEPLAALDEPRKAEILPFFERLRDEAGVPILYVSHAAAEVARLATTVVALEGGRVVAQGPALDILGDPSVAPTGVRDVGALLEAKVARHHKDGLTELDAGGVLLLLPRIDHPPGRSVRLRIAAQDVMLARDRPEGLSALNIVAGTVTGVRLGEGPGAIVTVATPAGPLLARVTRRSLQALGLQEGAACHAVVKSVAIAPRDVG